MENSLKYLAEFTELLKNYEISKDNLATLKQTRLVLLVGPTSSGRNTVIEELIKTGHYYHIVSDTTRTKRLKNDEPIEQNGREYWFRREDEILEDLRAGKYVEAAIIHGQQVSGCNIREIEFAQKAQKIAVKDIEPNGAQTIHEFKPDAAIIFVLPPSYAEWQRRLLARGELLAVEMHRRLESARQELEAALANNYYQFVINTTVVEAARQIQAIIAGGQQAPGLQSTGRKLAEELLRVLLD